MRSLANDNLSGIVVAAQLARLLAEQPNRPVTFSFLFMPATIGAITWLDLNTRLLKRIHAGLVLSNLGDAGPFTYKRSRRQNALIDQVAADTLARLAPGSQLRDFTPWGYDERQYCSPGFNLPVGRLTRTPEAEYPQYHTSADELSLISAEALAQSLGLIAYIITQFTARAGGETHAQFTAIQPWWSSPSPGECSDRECKHIDTHHSTVLDSTGRLRPCDRSANPNWTVTVCTGALDSRWNQN
jgi:aminopeptidase-like protein